MIRFEANWGTRVIEIGVILIINHGEISGNWNRSKRTRVNPNMTENGRCVKKQKTRYNTAPCIISDHFPPLPLADNHNTNVNIRKSINNDKNSNCTTSEEGTVPSIGTCIESDTNVFGKQIEISSKGRNTNFTDDGSILPEIIDTSITQSAPLKKQKIEAIPKILNRISVGSALGVVSTVGMRTRKQVLDSNGSCSSGSVSAFSYASHRTKSASRNVDQVTQRSSSLLTTNAAKNNVQNRTFRFKKPSTTVNEQNSVVQPPVPFPSEWEVQSLKSSQFLCPAFIVTDDEMPPLELYAPKPLRVKEKIHIRKGQPMEPPKMVNDVEDGPPTDNSSSTNLPEVIIPPEIASEAKLDEVEMEILRQEAVINYAASTREAWQKMYSNKKEITEHKKYALSNSARTRNVKKNQKKRDGNTDRVKLAPKKEPQSESNLNEAAAANPKPISIFKLLQNSSVLKQSLEYLAQLTSKEIDVDEFNKKLGIAHISDINSDAINRTIGDPVVSVTTNSVERDGMRTRASCRLLVNNSTKNITGVTNKAEVESDAKELVRELMSRYVHKSNVKERNREKIAEADLAFLSTRSTCMESFVPGYAKKFINYKKNALLIQEMSRKELIDNFKAVILEVKDICEGVTKSTRHILYMQGVQKEKELKELNVSFPFTNQQGMYLITHLYNSLFPDVHDRVEFTEYVTFVGLPETFIRIYAKVTNQTYLMAEREMRFGACYDENTDTTE